MNLNLMIGLVILTVACVTLLAMRVARANKAQQTTAPAPSTPTATPSQLTEPQLGDVQLHTGLYYFLMAFTLAVYSAVLFVAVSYWDLDIGTAGIKLNLGPGLFLLVLLHAVLSIRMVGAEEIGAKYCFGKALATVSPGLTLVVFGLMQLLKETRLVQEFQFPGEPENVFKGPDNEPLPTGMVRPIRVVTRAPNENEKENLDAQMALVVNFIVQFEIVDVLDFFGNIGNIELAQKQLRDIGEATLSEEVTQRTAGGVVRDLVAINQRLRAKIEERTQNWGIRLLSARMISPDLTHDVSKEFANIPIARAKAEQTRITAAAERVKRTEEGAGTAAAREALLTAEAAGEKKMKEALGVSGQDILAAETAQTAFDKADTIIVGAEGGMRDIIGAVKAAKTVFSTEGGAKQ